MEVELGSLLIVLLNTHQGMIEFFFYSEILESVFLEIEQPHQRNVIVGVIYR